MTKSELKNGMVVELRNGNRYLVHNDKLLNFEGYVNINDSFTHMFYYNEDLTYSCNKEFDIIRIYESDVFWLKDIFEDRFLNIIWERKEDKQELSKKDKKVIKKGLKKVQTICKEHKDCIGCPLLVGYDCPLNDTDEFDMDKLFKD